MEFRRQVAFSALILFALGWAALPLRGAMRKISAVDPAAMTVGCENATCCTSRCYLDEHGVHHCVPKDGASCDCGLASRADADAAPVLEIAVLPTVDSIALHTRVQAILSGSGISSDAADLAVPSPPPRHSPRPFDS